MSTNEWHSVRELKSNGEIVITTADMGNAFVVVRNRSLSASDEERRYLLKYQAKNI